jgi:5-amino-6-(5-phosphoribosylamino)uracil reductase
MRQLYPDDRDVDPAEVYDDPRRFERRERPHVFCNMVASVDGATVVDGVSGALGGDADRHVFLLLRSMADAILAGAQTVRAEGYGPPKVPQEFQAARAARGQAAPPRLAVCSRSLDLDWTSPLFTTPDQLPIVLTSETADSSLLAQARQSAEVIAVGDPELDLPAALARLGAGGIRALLCEGGPTLNGELLAAGLVDELCLTIAPHLVGRAGKGIVGDPRLEEMTRLELASVLTQDGYLFLRYLVPRAG